MDAKNGIAGLVRCEECDATSAILSAGKMGWDWFTGSLPRTHHWCPKHVGSTMYKATHNESQRAALTAKPGAEG